MLKNMFKPKFAFKLELSLSLKHVCIFHMFRLFLFEACRLLFRLPEWYGPHTPSHMAVVPAHPSTEMYCQEWEIDQLLQFCRCNFVFF